MQKIDIGKENTEKDKWNRVGCKLRVRGSKISVFFAPLNCVGINLKCEKFSLFFFSNQSFGLILLSRVLRRVDNIIAMKYGELALCLLWS